MKIKYNLKYGQKGLFLRVWTGNSYSVKKDIIISKDYRKIFKFLDLDYELWLNGFNTLEEIFSYVITSKYFNPEKYQLINLNRINRERNLKRVSYMLFLDYIKGKPNNSNYNEDNISYVKSNIITIIEEEFPEANIKLNLAKIQYEISRKALINAKFNGGIVMKRYGLEGAEIGKAISRFSSAINDNWGDSFDNYILYSKIEDIYSDFENYL